MSQPVESATISPTRALLAARRAGWRNRWGALTAKSRVAALVGAPLLVVALLLAGWSQHEALLAIPQATTLPDGFGARGQRLPGAAALDLAFWVSVFCSAVFSFRIMELLFRRHDIRSVDKLPLPMRAFFLDRLSYGLMEALGWGLVPAIFFLPLVLKAPLVAAATLLLCLLGPLFTLGTGVGIQLFFGGAEFGGKRPTKSAAPGEPSRAVDGYGGVGQVFLFAPGAALATSVVLVMLLKLSLGEMIRLEGFNRATALGVGIGAVSVAASLMVGWRHFKSNYFRMLAGFREADFVGFDVPIDYQTSAFDAPRAGEGLLPEAARGVYRRHVLQYGRKFALTRYLYALLWFGYGLALFQFEREALPPGLLAALPSLLLAILTNPAVRLDSEGVRSSLTQPGRLDASAETRAWRLFAAREALLFIAPFAALLLVLWGWRHGAWAEAAWMVGITLSSALAWASSVTLLDARWAARPLIVLYGASVLLAILLIWGSTMSLPLGLGLGVGVALLTAALTAAASRATNPSSIASH